MFIVRPYRISFEKSYLIKTMLKNTGRFDTVCRIESETAGLLSKGVAYIHPNDNPNKIMGKKVALTKALANLQTNKFIRTQIWIAFWKWIESWKETK